MPTVSNVSSFRRVTPGILASAHLASQEDRPKVTKKEISLVLKRVAPAIGIDGTAYHVLDILLGLVQADDFQSGKRPVVAISNQRLAEYTRRTTRTVTRCLKKLVEAGVLAYRDSPTGRRFVYRGSEGEFAQAYGLDFTPACFNLEAFRDQADAFQRRIKAEQDAKRAVTRYSRAIADLTVLDPAEFEGLATQAKAIVNRNELTILEKAAVLESLYQETLASRDTETLEIQDKMSSAGDIHVSPLFITTQTDSLGSNNDRTCSNEQEDNLKTDNGFAVEMALEKEPCGAGIKAQQPKQQAGRGRPSKLPETNLDGVSIGLIQSACSAVQAETGLSLNSWPALCGAAEHLRLLIGLSPSGYQLAVERQGKYLAAACLVVVAEKALRDPEQIVSPGGYFRAMIDRAGEGKLHLHKSLHGLVQAGKNHEAPCSRMQPQSYPKTMQWDTPIAKLRATALCSWSFRHLVGRPNMKVSANLGFLYTNLSISERIASAGEDGFEAVEFHWPYDVTPQELRVAMAAAGVSGLSLNTRRGNLEAGEFGLAALPGRENEARAAIIEAVEYAAASGLVTVHVMAGRAEGPAAEAAFVENLKFACHRAAVHRIGILIEPLNLRDVPGYFLTGMDHARRVIGSAGRSNLRILYDVYHMQIMQGDHVRTLEGLGDTVGHVQIAAVPDRTEPDQGEVDMHWLLERISYSGFVGAEYRPTREPRDWLRRFRTIRGAE